MRREVHPCGPGGRSRGHRLPAPLAPENSTSIRLAWRDKRTSKTRKGCTRVWCDIFTSAHFFVSLNLYFRGTTTYSIINNNDHNPQHNNNYNSKVIE